MAAKEQISINPWLVAIAVMTGTFMEVLDTTIVNVSLPHIAGSMSATPDEATWALTSYLVANAIVLPMTGWLANFFGRKRLLITSMIGFTVASFFCGFAPNLPFLIVFRVIQGACGGGLQPLSQAILLEVFPPEDRGKAMGFWGLGIVVAPMLGPVLGGWLTDNYSWRWVFYVNIPIGILAVFLTSIFVFDPSYIKRASAKIDYLGMALLALGIGALQIMLDKGQEDDWFGSHFIVTLAVFTVVGLTAFIIRELTVEHPIVDLRVFKNRTFATGTFLMTILGFVLYGSTVLVPLLLQTLLGYSAMDAGFVMLPRGLGSFIMMPLVGYLMSKIEPRLLLGTGIFAAVMSFFRFSHLSLDFGYWNFFWPLLLQGSALGLIFIPLTTLTNGEVPREQMGNATSLFNLMRNIGASIGISMAQTWMARDQQKHLSDLARFASGLSEKFTGFIQQLTSYFVSLGHDPAVAKQMAMAAGAGRLQQQAAILSYNQVFFIFAAMFAGMFPLIFLMRKPKGKTAEVMVH